MGLRGRLVDAIARAEEALDRLKLRYKERFDRFNPAHIRAYRGYGTARELHLRGRVMEANETGFDPHPSIWRRVRNSIRRVETDEIRGARVRITFRGQTVEAVADDEAFFTCRIQLDEPVDPGWHKVELEVVESMASADTGSVDEEVMVPSPDAEFMVLSDLDDTVLRSGADHKLSLARTFLMNDARTRIPFEGVVEFYRALAAGSDGEQQNPFVYLSRSPWNFYEMFVGFMDHLGFPRGPVILRDYGLRGMLGDDDHPYKEQAVRRFFRLYPDMPFVLLGDSGQEDPEIYRDIAMEDPHRVRAIFIRDVTTPERDREVREIAAQLHEMGVPMILAEDSEAAAEKAAELGLIMEDRLPAIEAERASEADPEGLLHRLMGGRPRGQS